MIDNFSLLLSHALLAYAFWQLLSRDDLDNETSTQLPVPVEPSVEQPTGFAVGRSQKKPAKKPDDA